MTDNLWVSVKTRLPKRGTNPANTYPRYYFQVQHGGVVYDVIWLDLIGQYGTTYWLDWQLPKPPVSKKRKR